MEIENIKNRIRAKLYGEEFTRGVLEFSWGKNKDAKVFNANLANAKDECKKAGIKWVDADPMTARIVVVVPTDQVKVVVDIMVKYGFELVNQIFDTESHDNMSTAVER